MSSTTGSILSREISVVVFPCRDSPLKFSSSRSAIPACPPVSGCLLQTAMPAVNDRAEPRPPLHTRCFGRTELPQSLLFASNKRAIHERCSTQFRELLMPSCDRRWRLPRDRIADSDRQLDKACVLCAPKLRRRPGGAADLNEASAATLSGGFAENRLSEREQHRTGHSRDGTASLLKMCRVTHKGE